MQLLDISYDEPARNLALDEALLGEAEAGRSVETLRFWESPVPFVVLGLTQRLSEEVHEDACARDAVPILRRSSGGGCVLQAPGCLNFVLVLEQRGHPDLGTIRASHRYILKRVCAALGTLDLDARLEGISDLAVDGYKVSGSAQRRRKRYLLHHGTLLYGADLGLISKYLKEPAKRPEYRSGRSHAEFVQNLPCPPESLKKALAAAFQALEGPSEIPQALQNQVDRLVSEKYGCAAWTRRR